MAKELKTLSRSLTALVERSLDRDARRSSRACKDLERPRDKDRGINSLVICEDQSLLAEEYSGAYKDVDHVVEDMVSRNLVKVIAILKPVLTYNTRSEDTDGEG